MNEEIEAELTETETSAEVPAPCEPQNCPPVIIGPPPSQRPPGDGRGDPVARLRALGESLSHAGPDRRLTTEYLRLRRSLR